MYFEFTVDIPKEKGKIRLIKNAKTKAAYVYYLTKRVYDPVKKMTMPTRSGIGKVCPEHPDQMWPNAMFFKLFPDHPFPVSVSELEPTEKQEDTDPKRSSCQKIGTFIAIKNVVDHFCLEKLLQKHFADDFGLMLDLAAYMIVDENNAGQYYPDYAYNHPLFTPGMRVWSDSKISRLLKSVDRTQIANFLEEWNQHRKNDGRIYVSYDSTNKNCQAGDLTFAEFGAAKDDKDVPIYNVALAFDQSNQVPLFYELYPGSINDISQFRCFVNKIHEYQYKSIGFILDRGYCSKGNILHLDKKGYAFLMMLKGHKELVSDIIMKNQGTFEDVREYTITDTVSGTTVRKPLWEGDKHQRYFHLFFDAGKYVGERKRLLESLRKMKALMDEQKGKKVKFQAPYTNYFDCHYDKDDQFMFAAEKTNVVERELKLCGYFCLISSEKLTASGALRLYKGRDSTEKLFRADKTYIGSRSARVQSEEALQTKTFIEFLALIIRNRMYNLLKDEMLRHNVRRNYMTVPAAIRELEKIELIRMKKDGAYVLDHAVTKTQREILASFGISSKNIQTQVTDISTMLVAERVTPVPDKVDDEIEDDYDAETEDYCED